MCKDSLVDDSCCEGVFADWVCNTTKLYKHSHPSSASCINSCHLPPKIKPLIPSDIHPINSGSPSCSKGSTRTPPIRSPKHHAPYLQKTLRQAAFPHGHFNLHISAEGHGCLRTRSSTAIACITESCQRATPSHTFSVRAGHGAHTFQFALEAEILLSFFAQLAFSAL